MNSHTENSNPSDESVAAPEVQPENFFKKLRNRIKGVSASKSQMSFLAKFTSYFALAVMALVMILPLLWLINGSFQPSWQINADPVIWIPREWKSVRAGDSERKIFLWEAPLPAAPLPAQVTGETDSGKEETGEVIQIGSRRYTTVVDAASLQEVFSVPRGDLSEAEPVELTIGDEVVTANLRTWESPQGIVEVIALAKDPEVADNLIVIPVESNLNALAVLPLDQVNQGKMGAVTVGGYELNGRQFEDGTNLVVTGPESELWVVGAPEIAGEALIVQSSRLGDKELISVGQTQIPTYSVQGAPEDARYMAIVQENWQPLMEQSLLAENAFVANESELDPEKRTEVFNGMNMTVRTINPADGSEPYDVVILTPGSIEYLVIPTTFMDQLYAAPISELVEPGSVNIETLTYRVQEDYERGGQITPSAFVGDIQDMAVIVPVETVLASDDASSAAVFDVSPEVLERSTRIKLTTTGYKRVLNLNLSGTPFYMFFVNSGYVVLMNMVGHFVSCVLVAYGFARLRAPGKNVLFVILLGTMMIPYTIVTLPTYIVFRDLGLLGTMVPLWIRSFFGNAFLIFVLRQFFMTIPYDLDEAAYLDGANRLQILLRIIVPLSKPALAMIGIFTFWWYWNSFLDPLIYITKQQYYTISLAMNSFNQLYSRSAGYYDRILAGSVLTLLPMVIIFLFAQRYFIEGIQLQGLKR